MLPCNSEGPLANGSGVAMHGVAEEEDDGEDDGEDEDEDMAHLEEAMGGGWDTPHIVAHGGTR